MAAVDGWAGRSVGQLKPSMNYRQTATVGRFRTAVRAYCAHVESRHALTPPEWLARVHALLVELYAAGLALPTVEPDTENANPEHRPYEDWKRMYDDFGRAFDRWNFYQVMFDPYDTVEDDPVYESLSDDSADIYADVRRGEDHEHERGDSHPNDVVWEWRFTFESHWAGHATHALYALATLQFVHSTRAVPESFGNWIGAAAT